MGIPESSLIEFYRECGESINKLNAIAACSRSSISLALGTYPDSVNVKARHPTTRETAPGLGPNYWSLFLVAYPFLVHEKRDSVQP